MALFDVKLPTLIVPETAPESLGRSVAVAWKQSDASGRAIDAALPLLRHAGQVTILADGDETDSAGCVQQLAQAGIAATLHRFETGGRKIGTALIAEAHDAGADLLVMGAYTHSRLTEFILGGATSDVLAAADLPVLMHH